MPAGKTHFQDLPVALDADQRLEIAHQHFDVCALPIQQQLLAWCDRMIGVVDLLTTRDERRQPFRGWIDRYAVGEFLFADCYTDRITQDRTIARISQDNSRSILPRIFRHRARQRARVSRQTAHGHGARRRYLRRRSRPARAVQTRALPARHNFSAGRVAARDRAADRGRVRRAGGAEGQQACARAGHGVRSGAPLRAREPARRRSFARSRRGIAGPLATHGLSPLSARRGAWCLHPAGMCACAPPPTSSSHGPAFRCGTSPMLTASAARRTSRGRFGELTASHRRTSGSITTACAQRQSGRDRASRPPDQPFPP